MIESVIIRFCIKFGTVTIKFSMREKFNKFSSSTHIRCTRFLCASGKRCQRQNVICLNCRDGYNFRILWVMSYDLRCTCELVPGTYAVDVPRPRFALLRPNIDYSKMLYSGTALSSWCNCPKREVEIFATHKAG